MGKPGFPDGNERGDQEPDQSPLGGQQREGHSALRVVGGALEKFDPHAVAWAWWATGSWREKEDARMRLIAEIPLCGRCYARLPWREAACPNGCSSARGPDPLLRIFNPRCTHDRCSESVMNCPECKHYTETHYGDPMAVGTKTTTIIEDDNGSK